MIIINKNITHLLSTLLINLSRQSINRKMYDIYYGHL